MLVNDLLNSVRFYCTTRESSHKILHPEAEVCKDFVQTGDVVITVVECPLKI